MADSPEGIADHGSQLVRATDVAAVAARLAREVDGTLVHGRDGLDAAVAERLEGFADRIVAHTAVDAHDRSADAPAPALHTVTTVVELRRLVRRIEQADQLVAASRAEAVDRAAATDVAVHPDALAAAARKVTDARAALATAEAAAEAASPPPSEAVAGADDPDGAAGRTGRWDADGRRAIGRALALVAACIVVAVAAFVLSGVPWLLVLPVPAACWVVVLVARRRDDEIDSLETSQNLARVSALTDRAYGGFGVRPGPVPDPHGVADAADRLRYAEREWRSLAGPGADVDDLDRVLQARDPRSLLSAAVVDAMPSVRAADAHRRRLRAQWKLAWWALDRPVPALEGAGDALDALEAEGIEWIAVEAHVDGAGERARERQRFEELARGRSIEELRAAAERTWPPLVVADPEATVTEARFHDLVARLPEDVRLLVVAPPEATPGSPA